MVTVIINSFTKKAPSRRCKNRIIHLKNSNGEWKEDNQLNALITDYFQSIFTSSNPTNALDFLEPLRGRITEPMNAELSKEFTREEIYFALN